MRPRSPDPWDTYDEAVRNAQDVLKFLIAGAQEGKPLPAQHLVARMA